MNLIMPMQIIAYFLVVMANSVTVKSIGSFCLGLMHIKISTSYTHCYELVLDKHRAPCSTVINIVDDTSLAIIGFILRFVHNDLNLVFKYHWIVGSVAIVLYMLIVPESPKWLFFAEGASSKKGIDVLNYIAWFNGSQYRVPNCAKLDIIGQAIMDNQTNINEQNNVYFKQLNNTINLTIINEEVKMHQSILNLTNDQQRPGIKKGGDRAQTSLTKLYCDKKQRSTSIWISILFASSLVIYYLGMYNSASLPGNIFTNQILCGSMLGLGNLIGGILADYNDSTMMQICLSLVIFFSIGIKLPGLSFNEFYFLYVSQIIVLGSLFSILLILQDRRVDDTFASMSLEINLSIGSFLTSLSPPLARLAEP